MAGKSRGSARRNMKVTSSRRRQPQAPVQIRRASDIKRPKRPPTAYNIFVKRYFAKRASTGRNGIIEASQRWDRLSNTKKARYVRQSDRLKTQHRRELSKYLKQRQAMKGPLSPYMQFYREFYNNLDPQIRSVNSVTAISKLAGSAWQALAADEKQRYSACFKRAYDTFLQQKPQIIQSLPQLGNDSSLEPERPFGLGGVRFGFDRLPLMEATSGGTNVETPFGGLPFADMTSDRGTMEFGLGGLPTMEMVSGGEPTPQLLRDSFLSLIRPAENLATSATSANNDEEGEQDEEVKNTEQ